MKLMALIGAVLGVVFAISGIAVLSLPWTYSDRFGAAVEVSDFAARWLLLGVLCMFGGGLAAAKNLRWYNSLR